MSHRYKTSCAKENLTHVRSFIFDFLIANQIEDPERNLLIVAVDEICANLIIHANACDSSNYLEIIVAKDQNSIIIEILDQGITFNPNSSPDVYIYDMIKDKRKGGIGIMLVKRIVDIIEYRRQENVNICKLVKYINFPKNNQITLTEGQSDA